MCNKIISLDLPVKDVYKKIWLPEHGEVSVSMGIWVAMVVDSSNVMTVDLSAKCGAVAECVRA